MAVGTQVGYRSAEHTTGGGDVTESAPPGGGDEPRPGTTGAPVVLIVDDEPAIAQAVAKLLARRGFEAVVAQSAAAAIERLRAGPVDGMVVDFHIGDMRGDVLYVTAIAIQPSLARRVVFVTGDVTDAACAALAVTGCVMLPKPFEIDELAQVVRHVIRGEPPDGGPRDGAADRTS